MASKDNYYILVTRNAKLLLTEYGASPAILARLIAAVLEGEIERRKAILDTVAKERLRISRISYEEAL